MSTAYIFNAMKGLHPDGSYETRTDPKTGETQYGTTLKWAGLDWWFPYQQVTPIPNYALCEVDHDKSTPQRGDTGQVVYRNIFVDGGRVAHELTENTSETSDPNKEKGIQVIEGKATGNEIAVFGGVDADSRHPIIVNVMERVATKSEIERCEAAAKLYKEKIIADYFDSKRQRMTGGQGKHIPDKVTRTYMNELNVEDNDDITAHQKNLSGFTPEMLRVLMEETRKGQEINGAKLLEAVETVRKKGKAQLSNKRVGARVTNLNLAANKAKWDAEHPEEAATPEEPVTP